MTDVRDRRVVPDEVVGHRDAEGAAPPEPSSTSLRAAARDLLRDLAAAQDMLDQIQPDLLQRVRMRMGTHLARATRQARALVGDATAGDVEPADVWAEVHALRCEVEDLLEECLVLVDGSAARQIESVGRHCGLADALVDELVARTPVGQWSSFTVMGRAEQYSRASRVIQVRFPQTSIWQLPLVGHELGHFVGPSLVDEEGLRAEQPLARLGATVGDGSDRSWAWLEELFADAFATRLLGPAFGYTCVLSAFDPLTGLLPTPTHPPPSQRVDVVVAVLGRSDDPGQQQAAERVGELWQELLRASGGAEGREPVAPSPYRDGLVDLLEDLLPISAFDQSTVAEDLSEALLARSDRSARSPTVAGVLNGAWLARLRSTEPDEIDRIGRVAQEWCERVARRHA